MIIRRKLFTVFDDTDNLKRMKDSDIIAEQKRKKEGIMPTVGKTAIGAGTGAAIGAGLGLGATVARGIGTRTVPGLRSIKGGLKSGGKLGAAIGGGLAALGALRNRSKHNEDVNFYNDRLDYAQRHALRRERKDWRANNTGRDGYTY